MGWECFSDTDVSTKLDIHNINIVIAPILNISNIFFNLFKLPVNLGTHGQRFSKKDGVTHKLLREGLKKFGIFQIQKPGARICKGQKFCFRYCDFYFS